MTKTEQEWRKQAVVAMRQAAEVLESYERLLSTMTSEAESFVKERALTERLTNHWKGAANALKQVKRHLPEGNEKAAKRLRKLVPATKEAR